MTEVQSPHLWKSCYTKILLGYLLLLLLHAQGCIAPMMPTSHTPMHSRLKESQGREFRLTRSARSYSLGATKGLPTWPPTDYRVAYVDDLIERGLGTAFTDYRVDNYSGFLSVPKQSVLYAIGDGMKLVKLDSTSLMLLDVYSLPQKTNKKSACRNLKSCQETTDISLLALVPSEDLVWFCYAHYLHRQHRLINFVDTGCMVPTMSSLTEPLLQWTDPELIVFDPRQPASVLHAGDGYTYIAGATPSHVQILRTRLPDWNGKVDWSGVLTLDKSRNPLTEPSEVLLTFETEDSVYFVVREQSLQRATRLRRAGSDAHAKSELTISDASCLVRICKNDPGGLVQFSADKFATFAKAELKCRAADESGKRFAFVYLTSAYWDAERQRLVAAFTTEKLAPIGSALCLYTKESIEAAFTGPILSQALSGVPGGSKQPISMPNEFPDICKRFNSKNITAEELSVGRRLSLSFPNRHNPIEPDYQRALVTQSGQVWRHLSVYSLASLPLSAHPGQSLHTSIVVLASDNVLLRLAIYEAPAGELERKSSPPTGPVVCKLSELRLGSNWQVLQRLPILSGKENGRDTRGDAVTRVEPLWHVEESQPETDLEMIRQIEITQSRLLVLTNKQILQLPLAECAIYTTYKECIQSKEPHCGWSWPEGQCRDGYARVEQASGTDNTTSTWYNTFSPSVDRWTLSALQDAHMCPPDLHPLNTREREWSDWYTCRWYSPFSNEDGQGAHSPSINTTGQGGRRPLGRCRCRMCLGGAKCKLGSQEVINCTSSDRNWLPWSAWSRCDPVTGVQTRHRSCRQQAVCVGSNREQRNCSPPAFWSESLGRINSVHGVSTSKRTKNRQPSVCAEGDTFTLNHILLVALFCLLIGSLVTTLVLFAYWQYCTVLPYSGSATHPRRPRVNSLIGHVTTDAEHWGHLPTVDDSGWISEVTSVSSRQPLTGSWFKNPTVKSSRLTSGRPKVQGLFTDSSKSPSTPGPLTTSTMLKPCFTFEGFETEGMASPTPSSHPVSPNPQTMRKAQRLSLFSGAMRPASADVADRR